MRLTHTSTVVLWRNTEGENNHALVAIEQADGTWLFDLYIEKPSGETMKAECSDRFVGTLGQLVDTFRDKGPSWDQIEESPGDHYKSKRRAEIPDSDFYFEWLVDYDSSKQGPMVLKDSLALEES